MDLNDNFDDKLRGRAAWVECFQRLGRDSGHVEDEDVAEEHMGLASETSPVFRHAPAPVRTQMSGQEGVCERARWKHSLSPEAVPFHAPTPVQGGAS